MTFRTCVYLYKDLPYIVFIITLPLISFDFFINFFFTLKSNHSFMNIFVAPDEYYHLLKYFTNLRGHPGIQNIVIAINKFPSQ